LSAAASASFSLLSDDFIEKLIGIGLDGNHSVLFFSKKIKTLKILRNSA